jgi:tricorn protease
MYKLFLSLVLSIVCCGLSTGETHVPLLLQKPAISQSQVAFVYAGDIWIVGRDGGDARRLTSGAGLETHPVFSPDGKQVAFAGEYEGNFDVYVVPSAGGVPRRLTYHPSVDIPVGWTPDGKSIVFSSSRSSYAGFGRLFTVGLEGGLPTELPLPTAEEGSLSPDGKRIAYVPFSNQSRNPRSQIAWKKYRGGSASPVWIADLADSAIEKVPREKSNDFNPMWVGERVYFLSDRSGPCTLFAYDVNTRKVTRLIDNDGPDMKSASACADAIVYDRFGEIHLYDLKTARTNKLEVRVQGDISSVRPHVEKVAKSIQKAALSPTGARAVFEARGEILTVPTDKGDIRNLTNTSGVAERDPAWSPDGKTIAYFSDESGEYELHLRPQNGFGKVRKITLGESPSFYYSPSWSPDGKHIAYTDKRLNYWYLDVESGKSTKIDTGPFDDFDRTTQIAWSPDSRWVAYAKQLKNYMYGVFVYSIETGKRFQITDGMSDARFPAFDKNGKYLYFLASTDVGPTLGAGMSSINRGVTRLPYVVVLSKEETSPLSPQSDEETDEKKEDKKDDKKEDKRDEKKDKEPKGSDGGEKKEPVKVVIDQEDMDQRILAIPVAERNYVGLLPGKEGTIFLLEGPNVAPLDDGDGESTSAQVTLHRFDFEHRKREKLLDEVSDVAISHNGEKLLYRLGEKWFVVAATGTPKTDEGALNLDSMELRVDPVAEWKQIYHEVWRIERDFLYDPHFHGLDIKAAQMRYAKYLPGLGSRYDLNYLLEEMLGELSLGHVFISAGDVPDVKGLKVGLLGADYLIENGRYRFARVYRGENWNPKLKAPLTQPGVAVKNGEYLLGVNGRELRGSDNVYAFFEGTEGKQTLIKVGPTPDGKGSREVTVVPIENERSLRQLAWVDENRRKVDQLSGGKVAYIYLPDTQVEGFQRFNRYFFAQAGREAAVIDERFNQGGLLADHVIDLLAQPLRNYASTREGEDQVCPTGIFGPKVMLINEKAGSGGDYLPYAFHQAKLGPIVGKRTWGGLVGIGDYPALIDGGTVTAPRWAIWFPTGQWEVENRGVAPDVEVELDPKAVRTGHDPQLEKAVSLALEELKKNPPKKPQRPEYPNYHKPRQSLDEK